MTYRELRTKLQTLTDEQLNQDLTVRIVFNPFLGVADEFYPAAGVEETGDHSDVLDSGHLVITVGE